MRLNLGQFITRLVMLFGQLLNNNVNKMLYYVGYGSRFVGLVIALGVSLCGEYGLELPQRWLHGP